MFLLRLPQLRFAALACSVVAMLVVVSCSTAKIQIEDPATRSPSDATININTADINTLEKLPHIGPAVAKKIIEHRERYGPFRKVEHLLVIDGIGESRFREIEHLISIE